MARHDATEPQRCGSTSSFIAQYWRIKFCIKKTQAADIVVLITLADWDARDHPGLVNSVPDFRTRPISELIADSLPLLETPLVRTVEMTISAPNLTEWRRVVSVLSAFDAPKLSCARHACATDLTWAASIGAFPTLPKQTNLSKLCAAVVVGRDGVSQSNMCFTWERLRDTLEAAHKLTVLVLADVDCKVPQGVPERSGPLFPFTDLHGQFGPPALRDSRRGCGLANSHHLHLARLRRLAMLAGVTPTDVSTMYGSILPHTCELFTAVDDYEVDRILTCSYSFGSLGTTAQHEGKNGMVIRS
ncbi:hypothetical protein C8R47DRAFT_1068025 [Mycena vitilis]|nr:hypothetical protein C8R47DRAFT_1068025 [Mycena vitilis]